MAKASVSVLALHHMILRVAYTNGYSDLSQFDRSVS